MVWFNGDNSSELIVGSNDDDTIRGGRGDDTILGGGGADSLLGNRGADSIEGGEGVDTLRGGRGNDTLIGNTEGDRIRGGNGDDLLIWNNGDGSDIMRGGRGFDTVQVNGAVDAGDDFELRANGRRAEFERLNLGNFVLDVNKVEQFEINGLGGDDTLTVRDLTGTDVRQVIFNGADGNDLLDASLSNTAIMANGGTGDDTLSGGSANDTLVGGNGNNVYTGGAGADVFVVSFDGIDVINDFNRVEGDILEISRSEFGISSVDDLTYDNATGILSLQDTQIATISNDTISSINSDSSSNLVLDPGPIFVPGEDLQLV